MMSGLTSATVFTVIGKNASIAFEDIVANFGEFPPCFIIISNDLFKSPKQRGLSRPIGPRLSIGCFFHPDDKNKERAYDPLEELISKETPKYQLMKSEF
ncbi:hypothetical protein Droror1_Dr00002582 [Drosera rotundifolia]